MAIEKLKRHKLPGTDQIPAELITAGSRNTFFEIHKRIISVWNKEELPEEWKESIIVPIYKYVGYCRIVAMTITVKHICCYL